MLYISASYADMRCLSVHLSRSWIMSKRINISSNCFSPSGSHTILLFPYQTGWRSSDGNPLNGGVECRWGMQKTRFWLRCIQVYSVVTCQPYEWRSVKNTAATNDGKRRTLIAASVVRTRPSCLSRARRTLYHTIPYSFIE